MDHGTMVDLRNVLEKIHENDRKFFRFYLEEMLTRLPLTVVEKYRELDKERLKLTAAISGTVGFYEALEQARDERMAAEHLLGQLQTEVYTNRGNIK